jgi:hypothetical protein
MNRRTLLAVWSVLGLLAAHEAAAQKLSLRIDKGLVTLDADNVTVDEVLARWIDTTGLNVVSKNGYGSDVPVSVHLREVSEREALTAVLRDVSGYIMGERRDPLTGVVTVDRLMILPQSAGQPGPVSDPRPARLVTPRRGRAPSELSLPTQEAPRGDEAPVELAPTSTNPPIDNELTIAQPAPVAPTPLPRSPFGLLQGAARPGQVTAPPPQQEQLLVPPADPIVAPQEAVER